MCKFKNKTKKTPTKSPKTLFLMKSSFLSTYFILGMVSTKYGCHGRPQPGLPAQGLTGSAAAACAPVASVMSST